MLDPFEKMGVQALQKAHESVGDSAGKVRDAASQYGTKEKDTIKTLKSAGGDA
jgi:hypothetical protein